jgi:flagellar export protein FliJ
MKPFHFSLEALRVLRQRQEQAALEQYAVALNRQRQAEERQQAVQLELEAAWQQRQNQMAAGAPAGMVLQLQNYGVFLEARLEEHAEAVKKASDEAVRRWETLLQARQQREIVDKYHDKQRKQHELDCLREEQKELDEFSTRRAAVNSASDQNDSLWN